MSRIDEVRKAMQDAMKAKDKDLPPLTIPWSDLKQAVSIIKEALSA